MIKPLSDKILSGTPIADRMKQGLTGEISRVKKRGERVPKLAVILVGENPASSVYVRHKEKACEAVGIDHETYRLGADISKRELYKLIHALNEDPFTDGILLQLPLPKAHDTLEVLERIDPKKDVDGLHPWNQGLLACSSPFLQPCTPTGILTLLDNYQIPLQGQHVAIIGKSFLVGRPMLQLCLSRRATVTMLHSQSKEPQNLTKQCDIVIVATGVRHLITRKWLSKKAIVIDVGIHRDKDGLTGDVDYEDVINHVSGITPVPGGVGPMTIAILLSNTLIAYRYHQENRPINRRL